MARLVAEFQGRDAERNAARLRKELNRLGIQAKVSSGEFGSLGGSVNKLANRFAAGLSVALAVREIKQLVSLSKDLSEGYESSLTRIETLVGVNRAQVAEWKEDILDLSVASGRAAQELSEAQFAITSAGIRGAESLDVLTASAKASAVGLGETRSIALASVAAMTAYGKENLSAAQATETLFKTVREGNLEAAELAPTLGRVIGLASELKISFGDVNAFIATVSRFGVPVEEIVTSLSATMSAFLSTTDKQREALRHLGTSADEVRQSLGERGLAATLIDLTRAAAGDTETLGVLIPNIRALRGVLAATGAQAEDYLEIERSLSEQTNELDKAFARVQETGAFASAQLNASWERLLITLGDEMAPSIIEIAGILRDLATDAEVRDFFGALGRGVGSFVAAVGTGIQKLSELRRDILTTLKLTFAGPLGLEADELERELNTINDAVLETKRILASGAADRADTRRGLENQLRELQERAKPLKEALREVRAQARDFDAALERVGETGEKAFKEAGDGVDNLNDNLHDTFVLTQQIIEKINELHSTSQELQRLQSDAIRDTVANEIERNPVTSIPIPVELDLEPIEGGLSQLADNIRKRLGSAMQAVADTWQDAVADGIDQIINGSGDISERIRQGFSSAGGQAGQTFGAQFGPIGAILGEAIGQKVGDFIGKIVGGLFHTGADEAFARITLEGRDAVARVRTAEGDTRQAIQGAAGAIADAINGIVDLLGGRLLGLGDLAIKIREGEFAAVWVAGVRHEFEEVEDAVRFAIVEGLKQAEISGLAAPIREALQNTVAETVEQLERDLQVGLDLRDILLPDISRQAMELVRSRVELFDEGMRLGISSAGDALIRGAIDIGHLRDAALGIQRSEEELSKERVDAFNAARDALESELLVRRAEIEVMLAQAEAQTHVAEVVGETTLSLLELAGTGTEALLRFRESMAETRGTSAASLDGLRGALAAIDEALESLAPRITEAERQNELRRQGRKERAEARGQIREEVENLGLTELGRQLRDIHSIVPDLTERMEGLGFSAEEAARLLGLAADEEERRLSALGDQITGDAGSLLLQALDFLGRSSEAEKLRFELQQASLLVEIAKLRLAEQELGIEIPILRQLEELAPIINDMTYRTWLAAQGIANSLTPVTLANDNEPPPLLRPSTTVRENFDSAADAARRIAESLQRAKENIAGFLVELQRGDFGGMTTGDAAMTAAAQVRELIAAAQGGSLSALEQFPSAARDALRLMREAFGSTPRFQEFLQEIQNAGLNLLDVSQVTQGNAVFDERLLSEQQAQTAIARTSEQRLANIESQLAANNAKLSSVLDDLLRRKAS